MIDLARCVRLCKRCYDEDRPLILDEDMLAFRGSANVHDFLEDAKYRQVAYGEGKVHEGFLAEYRERLGAIAELILCDKLPRGLWITGHSLGAAIALLAARDLHAADLQVLGVATFGCPRAGDYYFAKSISSPVRRIVYHADPVPRLPTPIVFDGNGLELYTHVGNLTWYTEEGQATDHGFMPWTFPLRLSDHHIDNYVKLFPELAPCTEASCTSSPCDAGMSFDPSMRPAPCPADPMTNGLSLSPQPC